jgi:hypothetical protein
MFFTGRKPNHVPRPDLFYWSTFPLRPTKPGCHDQRLTQRMGMPGRAGSWFKSHRSTGGTSRFICLK